ncbi:unnamed protein product, partial [Brachionus calyciflorus]
LKGENDLETNDIFTETNATNGDENFECPGCCAVSFDEDQSLLLCNCPDQCTCSTAQNCICPSDCGCTENGCVGKK